MLNLVFAILALLSGAAALLWWLGKEPESQEEEERRDEAIEELQTRLTNIKAKLNRCLEEEAEKDPEGTARVLSKMMKRR